MTNPNELLKATAAHLEQSQTVLDKANKDIEESDTRVAQIVKENEKAQALLDAELEKIANEGDEELATHLKATEEFDEPEA